MPKLIVIHNFCHFEPAFFAGEKSAVAVAPFPLPVN
jgi:hypothetical protein